MGFSKVRKKNRISRIILILLSIIILSAGLNKYQLAGLDINEMVLWSFLGYLPLCIGFSLKCKRD